MKPRIRRSWLIPAACGAIALTAAAALGQGGNAPVEPARPQRIMSVNMCNDLLLLMLVPKERIASITYLAHDAVEELMPGADAGIPVNRGTAEEVVMQEPDLILASPWTTPAIRRLGAKVDAPVVEIDAANNFDDIRRITRQIGELVGEPERAEELIADMDGELADLERTRPQRPVVVAAWSSGASVPGKGTLTDQIIALAGAENIAAKMPDGTYSSFSVEELLAARPDAIMRGEDRYDKPSIRESVSEHPAVRKAFRGRRLTYPASLYTCGLPQSTKAARQLREALAQIPSGGVPW